MFPPRVSLCLILQSFLFIECSRAYIPLSDDFLRNISSGDSVFDPNHGSLLSPILIPRAPGTSGHSSVQHHFVNFFSTELPKWSLEWHNSTAITPEGSQVPIANLIFKREPPWTKQGQANWLTLAAHYDSKSVPEGSIGVTDAAIPCAIMMHVASSIDQYATQMHTEMDALGEGGTVEMDMGVQIIFLDGKESLDGQEPSLYGSKALSETWEESLNPLGSRYPTALSQISILVLLDALGSVNPAIPSYLRWTSWAHEKIANLEDRMRKLNLLETLPPSAFFTSRDGTTRQEKSGYDHIPFMNRGVPFLHLLSSTQSIATKQDRRGTIEDDVRNLNLPTVRDWAKIMVGFALEWLDMMEVWPD